MSSSYIDIMSDTATLWKLGQVCQALNGLLCKFKQACSSVIKNALDSAPLRKKIRFGEERLPLVTMWQAIGQKLSGLSFQDGFDNSKKFLDPEKEGVFVRTSVSYWYLDEKWLAN